MTASASVPTAARDLSKLPSRSVRSHRRGGVGAIVAGFVIFLIALATVQAVSYAYVAGRPSLPLSGAWVAALVWLAVLVALVGAVARRAYRRHVRASVRWSPSSTNP